MYRAVDAASAEERFVRGIDDRLSVSYLRQIFFYDTYARLAYSENIL